MQKNFKFQNVVALKKVTATGRRSSIFIQGGRVGEHEKQPYVTGMPIVMVTWYHGLTFCVSLLLATLWKYSM
jgi:hypothetical protein